jgi:hypothetical protein
MIFLSIPLFSMLGYGTFNLGKFNFMILLCDCRKFVLVGQPVILRGGSMGNRFANVYVANKAEFRRSWKRVYFS